MREVTAEARRCIITVAPEKNLPTMTATLSDDMGKYVKAKIQSGHYQSAGEVVREGLRLLQEQDTLRQIKLEQLRKDIAIGIEAADCGELAPLDVDAIIAEGHKRLAEQARK